MTVKGVEVQLFDAYGDALASVSGIEVLWFDADNIPDISQIKGKSATVSTDSSGWIKLNIENVSGLAVGEVGFLVCYKQDEVSAKRSKIFASQMTVANITSGTDMYPLSDWVRNPSWLTLPDVTSLQKFAGLHAVYPDSNFVALSAEGNFTVNWGDGSGDTNVSSGVTAERNIAWADAPNTSDVGIADAVAVTFTDTGDTVNRTAHGYLNGARVAFSSITSTTGISTYTSYWVVGKTADTFQVSTTEGGSAIALTTNGSGSVYTPQYRQVIVTVVPNGGNITKLNLHIKHSQSGLQNYYTSGWLDIVISAQYMTDLRFGVQNPGATTIQHIYCEQFSIVDSDLRQLNYLFYYCYTLQSIPSLVTSSAPAVSAACTFTDTGDLVNLTAHGFRDGDTVIFTSVTSTTGITIGAEYYIRDKTTDTFKIAGTYGGSAIALTTNGSGTVVSGTNFANLFSSCLSLQSVSLLNTASCYNLYGMFYFCFSLQSVPLLDTSASISLSSMFSSCTALQSVPLLDTSASTTFYSIFSGCTALQSVPLLNTAAGTNFYGMFVGCSALQSVPLFNTAAGTNFVSMFSNCYTLETIPLLNTSAGTNFSGMFSSCYTLKTVPLLNTSAGTNFTYMFQTCYSLKTVPLLNTSAGTAFSYMFQNCYALKTISLFNTAAGTSFASMFSNCWSLASIPLLDVSSDTATAFTSTFANCPSLKRGALKNTKLSISYTGCELSAAALDEIYTALATITAKTITVTNNWGTASDTPSIATAKGWTVTG